MHWKSLNWVAHELNPPSVRRRREFCKLTLVYSSAVVEGVAWNKRELHTEGGGGGEEEDPVKRHSTRESGWCSFESLPLFMGVKGVF